MSDEAAPAAPKKVRIDALLRTEADRAQINLTIRFGVGEETTFACVRTGALPSLTASCSVKPTTPFSKARTLRSRRR